MSAPGCSAHFQSRLERHPLTRCCSHAPKNPRRLRRHLFFVSHARYSAADGLGALIQSRLTASATGDKSLLAKNAALTTTRQEPSCARLLACTRLRAQCRQRLFFCSAGLISLLPAVRAHLSEILKRGEREILRNGVNIVLNPVCIL